MKNYLVTALLTLFFISSFAQKEAEFCDIRIYQPGFKSYFIDVNYGNNDVFRTLKDTTGKDIPFVSRLDALKYMYAQGWHIETSYYIPNGYLHFILKK